MKMEFITISSLLTFCCAVATASGETYWQIHTPTASEASAFGKVIFSDATLFEVTGDNFERHRIAGSIFRVNTDGSGYSILKNFLASEGQLSGDLVLSGTTLYGTTRNGGNLGYGTVFSLNIDGTGFTVLKTFLGSDGRLPGKLVISGSAIYGTTSAGGVSDHGTLFRLGTDGSGFTMLKDFSQNDGRGPYGLVLAGSLLYGTTGQGGSSDRGTLFKLGTDGTDFTVLSNFTNSPTSALEMSGTTLFGITSVSVFKINTDGSGFTVLKTFTGPDGNQPSSLLLSGTILYGTTAYGGSGSVGTIFQLNIDGTGFSIIKNFDGTSGSYPSGLTMFDNTLYGSARLMYGLSLPTDAPKISMQPRSQSVQAGSPASLVTKATGAEPLTYQWYFKGTEPVPNGTDSTLQFIPAQTSQAGFYTVAISNSYGGLISQPAKLDVISPGTVPVNSCTEAGLRAALAGGAPVTFNCDGIIFLSSPITIAANTILDGSGHDVTISGGGLGRVFYINTNVTLTLKHLTIFNGLSTNGAGLYNGGGNVNVTNCTFVGNLAVGHTAITNVAPGEDASGGAILNLGVLNMEDCVFTQNYACAGDAYYYVSFVAPPPAGYGGVGYGGAICNYGTLNVIRSTISSNTVSGGIGGVSGARWLMGGPGGGGNGGALYNGGSAGLTSCAVIGNIALGGTGGGGAAAPDLFTPAGPGGFGGDGIGAVYGPVTAVNSTFGQNAGWGGAGGQGGYGFALSVHMSSSGGPGGGGGSGWAAIKGFAILTNCTIAYNSSVAGAGGPGGPPGSYLYSYGPNGPNGPALGAISSSMLLNSLLATNVPGGNATGALNDLGHNLSSDNTCNFTAAGSFNNTDLKLGPLADHGGSTLTIALLPDSPAIDSADISSFPTTDQRGFPRPAGMAADIGAFEYGSMMPLLTINQSSPTDLDLLVRGNAGQSCRLFTSPDFLVWMPIATTNIGLDGSVSFRVNCTSSEACRFYRVSMP